MIARWLKNLHLILTLHCERAEEIRLRRAHREATPSERVAESLHRAICGPCRRAARQQASLDAALRHRRESGDRWPPV